MDMIKGAKQLAERIGAVEVGRVHDEIIHEVADADQLLPIYAYLGIKPQPGTAGEGPHGPSPTTSQSSGDTASP